MTSNTSNNHPGPLPNRWLHCPRKSVTIIAERFLAFKVPLSKAFMPQMPIECIFTPEMIFDYCKTLKLKLGLWIDLTNTKRFYDRSVVESRGIQYIKLQCRGHGETPSAEQTHAFIEIIDNFINEHPVDIIAVHCTHGFNRTGFLIASYLVERLDFSLEAALCAFSKARPPGIYKQDYINELFHRYEDEGDPIEAPILPAWYLEYDDSTGNDNNSIKHKHEEFTSTSGQAMHKYSNGGIDDDDNIEDTEYDGTSAGSDGKPRKKRRRELVIQNPTFMAGVPGVTFVTDPKRRSEIQMKVQELCEWSKSGFPGTQPVSMDRSNVKRLHEIPYRVSWKADGTRYMMLIKGEDKIYFIDRNNSVFKVEGLNFVKAGNLREPLCDTLVDGEMVLDKFNGITTPRYLIYDIVKISGRDIGKAPFYPDRLRCIREEIIDPRYEAIATRVIDKTLEPFSVRNKEFWDIRQSVSLLGEKFAKNLSHKPDGLIFQPAKQPYTPGVCIDVLKWKPFSMNSVDFRLKITTEQGAGILPRKIALLYVGGHDPPFSRMKYTKALREFDNKIIECNANSQGQWEFMRERTDKTLPNGFNTAQKVIDSICHPVHKDYLLHFIDTNGFRDDSDIMPPPSSMSHGQRAPHQHPQQQHSHHQHPQQHLHHQQQQQLQQQHSQHRLPQEQLKRHQ